MFREMRPQAISSIARTRTNLAGTAHYTPKPYGAHLTGPPRGHMVLTLQDHRRICGPSLTASSSCGPRPYLPSSLC